MSRTPPSTSGAPLTSTLGMTIGIAVLEGDQGLHDLAAEPQHAGRIEAMTAELGNRVCSRRDGLSLDSGQFVGLARADLQWNHPQEVVLERHHVDCAHPPVIRDPQLSRSPIRSAGDEHSRVGRQQAFDRFLHLRGGLDMGGRDTDRIGDGDRAVVGARRSGPDLHDDEGAKLGDHGPADLSHQGRVHLFHTLLVLGENLLVTFLGWEGVGTCSYLLISFWFNDEANAAAAREAGARVLAGGDPAATASLERLRGQGLDVIGVAGSVILGYGTSRIAATIRTSCLSSMAL